MKIWIAGKKLMTHYYHLKNLNLKDITDKDYAHGPRVWEEFKIKNRIEYHDLYGQSDILLVADVFKDFKNRRIEIYGLDPAHFASAPGLAWQA